MFKKISIRHLLATVAVLLTASVAKAQSWDFTTTSTADVALLSADTENWTYTESSSRYSLNNTISSAALTANDTELTMTSGLLFTTTGSDKLRIDVDKRLILNGSTTLLTIPDLTAGQTVTIVFASSSSETARTITPSNLSSTSGFSAATSSTTQTGTGTVTADGSVTFTPSGGMYIYSLTVTDASGTEGSGSTSEDDTNYSSGVSSGITGTISSDNSDGLSTTANQALITSSDGKVRYYNTANLSSIDFDDANNKVTVKGSSFSDEYVSLATNVAFSKAADQGTSGTATGNINVTESKGWYESAYAKWTPVSGASSYSVKIKGGQYSDYTAIDAELIRTYSSYVRADVVGLQAGTDYSLLITALDSDGTTELATATVTGLEVSNYSREGFAHKASEISGFDVSGGIGAYKNDGTLKSGAKVLYVTPETAATISTEVKTGSSSTETFTGFQDIIYGYQKGYDTTPITFRIIGCIQADDVDSFGSSSEGIQIKGKNGYDEMNITIEGIGEDATIHGFGFLIRNAGSIEFRNLAIMWQMDDGLSLDTKNSNVWMHNLDMYYGQVGSDGDQAKGDGTIDIKGNSKYITVDHCHFWDTGKTFLCGMTSETDPNYITYHHNWFDHSDSRHARVRTMSVHMWNNYYDGCAKYGIGSTMGSSVFSENNYFRHTKNPLLSSEQGTDAKGDGTFSGEDGGIIKEYGSIFDSEGYSGNYTPISYDDNNTSFDAYIASTRDEQVPSSVVTLQGGTYYDNFDTDDDLMYTYTPDATANVPTNVTGYYGAGRLNHGNFQYTFDNSTQDTDYGVITALRDAISAYTGESVSISGSSSSETVGGSEVGDTDEGTDNNESEDTDDTESGSTSTDVTVTSSVECTFADKTPSNSAFTVTGNYSTSYGTATVNGTTLDTCVKMESSTSITFTTTAEMTLTLVFSETNGNYNIKVDGTKVTSDSNVLTTTLAAGSHTLTKADVAYLFYIGLATTSTTTE